MAKCRTVLVVDDDESIGEALELMLAFAGYHVETAVNGKDGIEQLSSIETPCMILLDLMMPAMDGWAFANALKGQMVLAPIPIVVITAFENKAQSIGNAKEVIKKPIDIDKLLGLVDAYCA
jgi:CheY-like chemotaxis protein